MKHHQVLQTLPGAEALIQGFEALRAVIQTYLNEEEMKAVEEAAVFGAIAHQKQMRQSGEPYFVHPLAVTSILAQHGIEMRVLQAALLHDVIEDVEEVHYGDLEERFGREVADMVEGVSKLGKLKDVSPHELAAGSFMKMMKAVNEDSRVLLVKLADRLHNMQTLSALRREKQIRIANETLEVYIPLAEHLGLYYFRTQLEDWVFRTLYPWRSAVIHHHYEHHLQASSLLQQTIQDELNPQLEALQLEAQIITRRRYVGGIHKRMQRKQSFKEALRTAPIRILTRDEDSCYRILGVLHKTYLPVEGKFKDFIATPKKNGYQSLHSRVMRDGQVLNVQIRTFDMDLMAEIGILMLAHSKKQDGLDAHLFEKTVQQIQSWLDVNFKVADNPLEFYSMTKQDLTRRDIQVYTPRGDVVDLPYGATPIDFAYAIHGYLGNHCAVARADGQDIPLHQALRHAQTIEILTDSESRPQLSWLNTVVTERARVGIKRYLARMGKQEASASGKQKLEEALQSLGLLNLDSFRRLQDYLQQENISEEALFVEIGQHKRPVALVVKALQGEAVQDEDRMLIIKSASEHGVQFCRLCHPLPQEAICAEFNLQSGLTVHRKVCKQLQNNPVSERSEAQWASETEGLFVACLRLNVQEGVGVLAEVTQTIAQEGLNILDLDVNRETHENLRQLNYCLEVPHLSRLQDLMKRLRALPQVVQVQRD